MPKKSEKKTERVAVKKRSKAWKDLAPKTKEEREKMMKHCGPSCFLDPDNLAYPICPKSNIRKKSCKPTQQGIKAAYSRAIAVQNTKVIALARKAMKDEFDVELA